MELLYRVASSTVALVFNVCFTAIGHHDTNSRMTGRFGAFSDTALKSPQASASHGHFSSVSPTSFGRSWTSSPVPLSWSHFLTLFSYRAQPPW